MPDPSWTEEYNVNLNPSDNGFTRRSESDGNLASFTTGTPSSRRFEITHNPNSRFGEIWLRSDTPTLDPTIGVTVEGDIGVVGSGDAGFELTFLNAAVQFNVFENVVNVHIPRGDDNTEGTEVDIATSPNTSKTKFRGLFTPDRNFEVYRNGVLLGSWPATTVSKPSARILFWGEGGGTQTFWGMRYYIGGAVAPG